jgi:hypothetical protein
MWSWSSESGPARVGPGACPRTGPRLPGSRPGPGRRASVMRGDAARMRSAAPRWHGDGPCHRAALTTACGARPVRRHLEDLTLDLPRTREPLDVFRRRLALRRRGHVEIALESTSDQRSGRTRARPPFAIVIRRIPRPSRRWAVGLPVVGIESRRIGQLPTYITSIDHVRAFRGPGRSLDRVAPRASYVVALAEERRGQASPAATSRLRHDGGVPALRLSDVPSIRIQAVGAARHANAAYVPTDPMSMTVQIMRAGSGGRHRRHRPRRERACARAPRGRASGRPTDAPAADRGHDGRRVGSGARPPRSPGARGRGRGGASGRGEHRGAPLERRGEGSDSQEPR